MIINKYSGTILQRMLAHSNPPLPDIPAHSQLTNLLLRFHIRFTFVVYLCNLLVGGTASQVRWKRKLWLTGKHQAKHFQSLSNCWISMHTVDMFWYYSNVLYKVDNVDCILARYHCERWRHDRVFDEKFSKGFPLTFKETIWCYIFFAYICLKDNWIPIFYIQSLVLARYGMIFCIRLAADYMMIGALQVIKWIFGSNSIHRITIPFLKMMEILLSNHEWTSLFLQR